MLELAIAVAEAGALGASIGEECREPVWSRHVSRVGLGGSVHHGGQYFMDNVAYPSNFTEDAGGQHDRVQFHRLEVSQ